MPKLFNKETGEAEIVGFDQVNEAVLSGKYRFGSAQVPLLHPRGEDIFLFPSDRAEEIMRDNNYRFPDKDQTVRFYERLDADIAAAEKEEDLEEKYGDRDFAAAGLGLLRGVSIGLSDPALIKSGLFTQEELREIDERNQAASTASEIAGAVLPAFIPGVGPASIAARGLSGAAARGSAAIGKKLAGEAAKKSVARVGASYGVAGAVEGAAYGIGQTISEDALGRGEATAEAYVANIGAGTLLGGGGGILLGSSASIIARSARSTKAARWKQIRKEKQFRRDVLHRRVTNEKIIEGLGIVNEIGIPFSVNNMIGFPGETYELAFETIELNRKIYADDRNAYPFSPFHGVPLRKECDRLGYTKYEDIVESMVASGSILDMPQFSKESVEGLCKTFNLYVSFPKSRWPEIKLAEKNTPEGQEIFEVLKEEFVDKYLYKDPYKGLPLDHSVIL